MPRQRKPKQRAVVYLIRLSRPLGGEFNKALYYLGSTNDIERRWQEHLSGRGSPMLRAAIAQGIVCEIVALKEFPTESEARAEEIRLKRWKNNKRTLRCLPAWGVPD
jgi:predicted GIY-YIG superfamily endonuclease